MIAYFLKFVLYSARLFMLSIRLEKNNEKKKGKPSKIDTSILQGSFRFHSLKKATSSSSTDRLLK